MGISNKLGTFFVGVNLLLPTFAHALVIEPVKIDSSQGEPLYAEIPFHNASSQSPLQVSIAQPFELGLPEVLDPAKVSHYNFYVRQNTQGNGVIVITSSRPIHESALSLVLKVNDNGQIHMQQLHHKLPSRIDRLKSTLHDAPLQPRIVVNEDDLKLNLPESSPVAEQNLAISQTPPPMLNNGASNIGLKAAASQQNAITTSSSASISPEQNSGNLSIQVQRRSADQPFTNFAPTVFAAPAPNPQTQQNTIVTAPTNPVKAQPKTPQKSTATTTAKTLPDPSQQHKVQANESLWAIANQIAKNQKANVQTVMQDIHQNNQHAFANGNMHRLKQGAVLNIPPNYTLPIRSTEQAKTQPVAKTVAPKNLAAQEASPQKQSEAHMSIVANTNQGAIQGTNKTGANNSSQQNEFTVKLKQARGATLALQNNVRQLDQQLREKEKRIALLNARLAELEQQLKSRQTTQNTSSDLSKTTSKSQGVIPALIAGTLVAFAGLNSNFAIATLLQELI